jgi:small GTP-binding protein
MRLVAELGDSSKHKVVILGDSRVGKTSIITYQTLGYRPPTQNPTIGCHCSEVHIPLKYRDVTLQVWDTAGQELYKSLVPVYLRGARAALIVYDVTDRESFLALNRWYEMLIDAVPTGISAFLVGNKIDLSAYAVVDESQAKQFASPRGLQFFHVSAVTGEGLDSLFEAVATAMEEGASVDIVTDHLFLSDKPGCKC